ncbi:hypothetical protein KC19_10G176400 [Ceratodon purpureus]|uniref:Uncharacterized protein n=1 Tax=Ceratodon purpureus TaxID=3225 RepID=A0A8T0GP58_CERPU|nr:hypothetical protein KC19_10G176400 [Ceratodon purpureus]
MSLLETNLICRSSSICRHHLQKLTIVCLQLRVMGNMALIVTALKVENDYPACHCHRKLSPGHIPGTLIGFSSCRTVYTSQARFE